MTIKQQEDRLLSEVTQRSISSHSVDSLMPLKINITVWNKNAFNWFRLDDRPEDAANILLDFISVCKHWSWHQIAYWPSSDPPSFKLTMWLLDDKQSAKIKESIQGPLFSVGSRKSPWVMMHAITSPCPIDVLMKKDVSVRTAGLLPTKSN